MTSSAWRPARAGGRADRAGGRPPPADGETGDSCPRRSRPASRGRRGGRARGPRRRAGVGAARGRRGARFALAAAGGWRRAWPSCATRWRRVAAGGTGRRCADRGRPAPRPPRSVRLPLRGRHRSRSSSRASPRASTTSRRSSATARSPWARARARCATGLARPGPRRADRVGRVAATGADDRPAAGPAGARSARSPVRHARRRSGARPCTSGTRRSARAGSTWATGSARSTTATSRPSAGRSDEAVGLIDVSTLGKLDVAGRDAGSVPRLAPPEPLQRPDGRARALPGDARRRRHRPRRRHGRPARRRALLRLDDDRQPRRGRAVAQLVAGRVDRDVRHVTERDRRSSRRSTSPVRASREVLRG